MPTCNCETNGCRLEGGVQLPLRTVRDHAHVDQVNRYERARIASEEALRDQEEAIATQLASMTLAVRGQSFAARARLFLFILFL